MPDRSLLGMNSSTSPSQTFRALIAGGGVAALETALALRELAGGRVSTTLLAPDPEFVYRPMRVREPFGYSLAQRYSLEEIVRDINAELVRDAFKWLDADNSVVHTEQGQQLEYDALVLAVGARLTPAFDHAVTIDDRHLDERLHGLLQDLEGGYVKSIAFIAPDPMPWPLPLYELALMTAARAYDMGVEVAITIATPEDAPLAVFGEHVSETVKRVLDERGIDAVTSAHCEVPEPGVVSVHPGDRTLRVERVVALPRLSGPAAAGVPSGPHGGFIPVDAECRVPHLDRIWAAGDATDFPVKFGGIASQQADCAAAAIAALAGAPVDPVPFHPEIHGVLLGGDKPLYMSAHVTGGHGSSSTIGEEPTWSPPTKIAAKYLAPYLESHAQAALR
jgi:sulfide:quinone oxidoreductase